jgi:hypothetical protein
MLMVAGCNETSTESQRPPIIPQGPVIFVTSRPHGGDFTNDPYLTGANGIAKADVFCNSDPAKPSAASYKALLVDGVNRDAHVLLDWVLKPDTAYYRPDGELIGTTTAAAIFGSAYQPLAHPIVDPATLDHPATVWTGIGSQSNFSTGNHCNHWSDLTNSYSADFGAASETDGSAFSTNGLVGCYSFQFPIYCVEQ